MATKGIGPATPGDAPTGSHRPVLLHPLIKHLNPTPGACVVDATLGGGGVTAALLDAVGPTGHVIACDRDGDAIARAAQRWSDVSNLELVHTNFSQIATAVPSKYRGAVDGICFDLGLSSPQLDTASRGFSFMRDGPIDMRMDQSAELTGATIVNEWDLDRLVACIKDYSDERFATRIAKAIVAARPLESTVRLAHVISQAIPRSQWPKRIHPATRTFQALRIAVNDELSAIAPGINGAVDLLSPGGRLGIISFHSLEDTIVKRLLYALALTCVCPPQQPFCTCAHRASLILPSRRGIPPSEEEIAMNPRARSARLRIAVRTSH